MTASRFGFFPHRLATLKCVGLLLTTVVVSNVLLFPGLYGPFILDDIPNLKPLNDIEAIGRDGLWYFVFSGGSSATGRPLALLTFALQASSWPDDVFSFKLVNLVLHSINGALIFVFLRQLLPLTQALKPKYIDYVAALITFIWLVHPIQHSSVFYVIQRMALIGNFFILITCLLYFYCRVHVLPHNRWLGTLLSIVAIYITTAIGILGKEIALNGILLVLVLDLLLPASNSTGVAQVRLFRLAMLIPIVAFITYLVAEWQAHQAVYDYRLFSLPERIMTQARVMFSYLSCIIWPVDQGMGVFHDDYMLSTALHKPITTLFSIVGVVLIVISVIFFRLNPLIRIGLAIFFAGHLLEGSVIPLQLYFEHRNYLPLLGILIAIAGVSLWAIDRLRVALVIPGALVVVVIISSIINVAIWRDQQSLLTYFANTHPTSIGAVNTYANYLFEQGRQAEALRMQHELFQRDKSNFPMRLFFLRSQCKGEISIESFIADLKKEGKTVMPEQLISQIRLLIADVQREECAAVTQHDLTNLVKAVEQMLGGSDRFLAMVYQLKSDIALINDDFANAVDYLQASHKIKGQYNLVRRQYQLLSARGFYHQAYAKCQEALAAFSAQVPLKDIVHDSITRDCHELAAKSGALSFEES